MAKTRTRNHRDNNQGSEREVDRGRFLYELFFVGDEKPIRFYTHSDREAQRISEGILSVTGLELDVLNRMDGDKISRIMRTLEVESED